MDLHSVISSLYSRSPPVWKLIIQRGNSATVVVLGDLIMKLKDFDKRAIMF